MAAVGHHVLLALATLALGLAALRVAARLTPAALERAISAVVLGAAAAFTQALGLGLFDLGTSWVALSVAAGATWLGVRACVPTQSPSFAIQLGGAWRRLSLAERVMAGALAGAWLAWAAWLLRHPALGVDSIAYHLPEVLAWVHDGSPGGVVSVLPGFPTGSFPLANEVLLAWSMGISHSFVPATIWAPLFMGLLALAGWTGLRSLRVPRLAAGLAVAASCAAPVLTSYSMNGASTDLPALAWLVCCAALCAASRERPVLLTIALLAGGLAVGTKTTTAPLVLLCLVLAFVRAGPYLRALSRPLAVATPFALLLGLLWPLRNLVDHGSPLWPHLTTPWGDPAPEVMARGVSFLERPRTTLERLGDGYLDLFGGGILLLIAALAVPFLAHSRAVTWASLATAVSIFFWTNSPLSGVSESPLLDAAPLSTVRYLTPGLAAATVTLALAARCAGPARPFALVALASGLGIEVVQGLDLGFPRVPSFAIPLAGALLGVAVTLIASRSIAVPARAAASAGAALAIVVGAIFGLVASGFGERHARTGLYDREMVRFVRTLPGYEAGEGTISMSPVLAAPMAGDSLQHELELIPRRGSCRALFSRLRGDWVIVHENPLSRVGPSPTRECLASRAPDYRGGTFSFYDFARPDG